ncbi:MAG: AraC family transcriptional regulator ligand-binding domain-containing protein [Polyangiales bacterium]
MVPLLLTKAATLGGDLHDIRRRFSLSEPVASTIAEAQLRALANHVAGLSGDPFFGLHLGAAHRRGLHGADALGALELVCSAAPTLGGFFERLARFAMLVRAGTTIEMVHDGELVRLERSYRNRPDAHEGRHLHEFVLATFIQVVRYVTADQLRIVRVALARRRPVDCTPAMRFFGTDEVITDAETMSITIPAAQLDLPCVTHDPALVPVLDEYARVLLSKVPERRSELLAGLHDAIRALLHQGDANVRRVASKLSLSSRTLQRKLAQEGISFQQVLDDVRRQLASHYLQELGLTPDEVATRLGYSEARAFFRAYKRWTGETPKRRALVPVSGAIGRRKWHDPSCET